MIKIWYLYVWLWHHTNISVSVLLNEAAQWHKWDWLVCLIWQATYDAISHLWVFDHLSIVDGRREWPNLQKKLRIVRKRDLVWFTAQIDETSDQKILYVSLCFPCCIPLTVCFRPLDSANQSLLGTLLLDKSSVQRWQCCQCFVHNILWHKIFCWLLPSAHLHDPGVMPTFAQFAIFLTHENISRS